MDLAKDGGGGGGSSSSAAAPSDDVVGGVGAGSGGAAWTIDSPVDCKSASLGSGRIKQMARFIFAASNALFVTERKND